MTQEMSPADQLHDRLTEALGAHDVHPEDRMRIVEAYQQAGMDTATWDDLPADIQQLVIEAEKLPVQSWDDPADVPDRIYNEAGHPQS